MVEVGLHLPDFWRGGICRDRTCTNRPTPCDQSSDVASDPGADWFRPDPNNPFTSLQRSLFWYQLPSLECNQCGPLRDKTVRLASDGSGALCRAFVSLCSD